MTNLIKKSTIKSLITKTDKEHKQMLINIGKNLPKLTNDSNYFGKTQSQFMDNFLTISKHTPLRNARQCLSEVEKSMNALQENYYKNKKKEVEIRKLQRKLTTETDELELELIAIEIEEKKHELFSSQKYINGAIRKVNNYTNQYNTILANHNKTEFTEEDFEKQEEAYHISNAFHQAITAARSRNGIVDEGNHIYFAQIGINGAIAQAEINGLFHLERAIIDKNQVPSIRVVTDFLDAMIEKYRGCSNEIQEVKKMEVITKDSLINLNEAK